MRTVFVVHDSSNSWSGEITARGVYTSREAAEASLFDKEPKYLTQKEKDLITIFLGNTGDSIYIDSGEMVEAFERQFPNVLNYDKNGNVKDKYLDLYTLRDLDLDDGENLRWLTISEVKFYE